MVAEGSGTINFAGLQPWIAPYVLPEINPQRGLLAIGSGYGQAYVGAGAGPATGGFGQGPGELARLAGGDPVLIGFRFDTKMVLVVPWGYVSGSPLVSSAVFDNVDLSQLGVDPGTYVWSWGSGDDADTFTLNIIDPNPPTAVPAPPALALFGVGLVGLFASRRRRA